MNTVTFTPAATQAIAMVGQPVTYLDEQWTCVLAEAKGWAAQQEEPSGSIDVRPAYGQLLGHDVQVTLVSQRDGYEVTTTPRKVRRGVTLHKLGPASHTDWASPKLETTVDAAIPGTRRGLAANDLLALELTLSLLARGVEVPELV